ncbi:hypothetical protein FBU59_001557 [Linderina macrospora]|uniref:Uncharacterized protein n=1 Tax=Linderina macrospora TaxID=4868 RepID=A0ACC1JDN6_9FUNG|nr:hypothetical protein FBU59_001557 [Linderina macrospora]
MSGFRTSERRPKRRSHHRDVSHAGVQLAAGSPPSSMASEGTSASSVSATAAFLAGIDSATDDGSTTSSSVISRGLQSRAIYTLPEQLDNSESEAQDDIVTPRSVGYASSNSTPTPAHSTVFWSRNSDRIH